MTSRPPTIDPRLSPANGAGRVPGGDLTNEEGPAREGARLQLRLLDECLNQLESANERDDLTVTPELAAKLAEHVPGVTVGLRITQALDLVFREQEKYLPGRNPDFSEPSHRANGHAARVKPKLADSMPRVSIPPTDPARAVRAVRDVPAKSQTEALDSAGARALTEDIRTAGRRVCILLLEAHQRHAWSALGYPTWERYVHREFGMSRSRSYELLDQGRFLVAIRAAAGLSGYPDITAVEATQARCSLAEIVEEIRTRVAGVPQERAAEVAATVVREYRARRRKDRGSPPRGRTPAEPVVRPAPVRPGTPTLRSLRSGAPPTWEDRLSQLYEAVELLATMPSVRGTVARVPDMEAHRLRDLGAACTWLSEFALIWSRRFPERDGPEAMPEILGGGLGRVAHQ